MGGAGVDSVGGAEAEGGGTSPSGGATASGAGEAGEAGAPSGGRNSTGGVHAAGGTGEAGEAGAPSGGQNSTGGVHAAGGTGEAGEVGEAGAPSGGRNSMGGVDSAGGVGEAGEAGAPSGGGTSASAGAEALGGAGQAGEEPTAGDGGEGGEAEPICPSTHQCIPEAPEGWEGPDMVGAAAELGSCTTSFPDDSLRLGTDLSADDTCICDCSSALQSDVCTAFTVDSDPYTSGCSNAYNPTEYSGTQCLALGSAGTSQRFSVNPPIPDCSSGSYAALGPASFQSVLQICGGATAVEGACATTGEICLPKATALVESQICIHREGLVDCPAEYPDGQLLYHSLDDGRACPNSCSCTATPGVCSVGMVFFATGGCDGGVRGTRGQTSEQSPFCQFGGSSDYSGVSVTLTADPTVASTCSGTSIPATGLVTGEGAVTVCCRAASTS